MAMHYGDDEVNTSNSSGNNDAETDKWYNIIKDAKSNEETTNAQGQAKGFWEFIRAHWQMIKGGNPSKLDLLTAKYNPHEGSTSRKWLKFDLHMKENPEYLYFSVSWRTEPEIILVTLLRTLSQYFTQEELENIWWTIHNDNVVEICVAKRLTEACDRIKKANIILLRRVFAKASSIYKNTRKERVGYKPNTKTVEIFPVNEDADCTNLVDNNANTFDQSDSMEVQQIDESSDNGGSDESNQNLDLGVQSFRNNNSSPTKKRKLDQITSFTTSNSMSPSSEESFSAPSTDGVTYIDYILENHICAACRNADLINDEYLVIPRGLKVMGDIIARHFYHTSDQRLKCDIEEFNGAKEILLQLYPKYFRWKSSEPFSDPIIGLIAQEVQEVAPRLVKEGQDGYLSIDYGQIIVILIEAAKQLLSDSHASNDEQKVLQNSLRLLEEEFKGLFNTVSKVVQNQQRQQGLIEERFIRLETRLTHLENDNNILYLNNCRQIKNIFTTLEHGHKLKMAQISIFESLVLEKQNWTRIERQNLMLKLIFLFPSYVGNFTRKQLHGILKQIQSVTLWAKAETDAMAKLCVGVLLYSSGKRFKAAKQFQQLLDAHDTQTQKMALAYLIAIRYSNDNEEDAVKLTNDLQRMLPNDKEKNYYGNQVVMMRVSYLFKQRRVEEIEEAISEWRNMVTVSTKGDSTQYKILHYLPIDIFQAEYQVLRNNYSVAEKILDACLSSVGDSHHYAPLLKSKLLGVRAKQCKYDEAISLSEELLSTERTNFDVLGVLSELKNLVNLYYSANMGWNTALEDNFNFVVKSSDEITEDNSLLHNELLDLVRDLAKDVSRKLKQRQKGIVLLQKFINILENRSTIGIESKILAYNDLGVLYYEQKDLKSAEKYFSQCSTSANGSSDIQHKLTSKQNLARFYMDTREWQKAQQWTYQQIKILNESKDDISDYQALKYRMLYQLSEIYFEVQNWKMMESCLRDCLKLATGWARQLVLYQFVVLYRDKRAQTALKPGYCAARLLELSNQSEADGQKLVKLITDKKKK